MKLQMRSVHFDADQTLVSFIQKKVDKLDTFYNHIIEGEVVMRVEKGNSQEDKRVEIKVFIPGNMLFVSEQAKSFEEATDLAVDAMRRQLKKHKTKQIPHL